MGKLNKQSPSVGKYLKWHKEMSTGGNLPNVIQQTNYAICPNCGGEFKEYLTCYVCRQCHIRFIKVTGKQA